MLSSQWSSFFFTTLFILLELVEFSTSAPYPVPEFPCKPPHHSSYPFCNTSLSIPARATSLVSLLTLHEKISLLSDNASSVPSLGIPSYQWWSESLHGISTNGPGVSFDNGPVTSATSFPQVIVSAASFNRTLWSLIASAVAVEARAMYNVGQAGLTFWAPNINVFRDPRWGRGQETPGEDPMVGSAYAVEYVRGFQGGGNVVIRNDAVLGEKRILSGYADGDGDELMVSACCKHFTAYDLELWGQFSRYNFNAVVTKQDLEDTYQPPFRTCIQKGKASCLMCSYNAVNGVPACADGDLLGLARNKWGFKGYITSDCDAVATVFEGHKFVKSQEDAVADVLKAGVDINCGSFMVRHTESAIEQGKVKEEDLDRALFNLFSVLLRLGWFDGDPKRGQFGKLGPQDVCTPEHLTLALEAARQGIVLLKNDNKFLPLDKNVDASLAVIGPMAISDKLGGGYVGGRLPMTWYPESFTNVPMTDMSMRADPYRGYPGRTYRFYTGSRVYGFGHGLSYSDYSYKFLSAPSTITLSAVIKAGTRKSLFSQVRKEVYEVDYVQVDAVQNCDSLSFPVHISVMNLGDFDGSHAVMLFSRGPKVLQGSPETQLVGFSRVHTTSHKSTETSILVDPCEHLSFADEQGKRILPLGHYILSVGDVEHIVSIDI